MKNILVPTENDDAMRLTLETALLCVPKKEFDEQCIRNGGMYVVARSIDDVQRAGL